MTTSDYTGIERTLRVVPVGDRLRLSADKLAADLGLSLSGYDRLVRRWSGVDPKTFLRILTERHEIAEKFRATPEQLDALWDVNFAADRGIRVNAVVLGSAGDTEHERVLDIRYGAHDSPFGRLFIAVTPMGICKLSFPQENDHGDLLKSLEHSWPGATMKQDHEATAPIAAALFQPEHTLTRRFPVVLKGTRFQLKVWKTLLTIPMGKVCSYGQIARAIGQPKASRAVGSAVAANPVAYLIPCHRVICSSGATGNYRWGESRKRAMLCWEACKDFLGQENGSDLATQ